MGGVAAADIERGIGLGIAQSLRLLQDLGEVAFRLFHVGEDVVAGAVQDSAHRQDAMRDQAFAQRFHDRNTAGGGGLEFQRKPALLRHRGKPRAVMREQRLVRGHDVLAGGERSLDQCPRDAFFAADQFDNDVRIGLRQRYRIVEPSKPGDIGRAALVAVARGDGDDFELALGALGKLLAAHLQAPSARHRQLCRRPRWRS